MSLAKEGLPVQHHGRALSSSIERDRDQYHGQPYLWPLESCLFRTMTALFLGIRRAEDQHHGQPYLWPLEGFLFSTMDSSIFRHKKNVGSAPETDNPALAHHKGELFCKAVGSLFSTMDSFITDQRRTMVGSTLGP